MKYFFISRCFKFFLLVLILTACSNTSSQQYYNYKLELSGLIDSLEINREIISILIDKSDYKLTVMSGDKKLKEYPIVFGGNPVDDKLCEGDLCTPEGTFNIQSKYPHKSWSKFVWINYPTSESWVKHKAAKASGEISADASIGGEIGIHGVPEGTDGMIDNKNNWTLGCISLKNKDIEEIFPFLSKTTIISIQK